MAIFQEYNIQYKFCVHRNVKVILCFFPYNPQLLQDFKKTFPSAKWSRTHTAWYLPDSSLFRKRLQIPLIEVGDNFLPKMYSNNQEEFIKFRNALQQKMFSPATIKTYLTEFAQLLILLKNHPVQNLNAERLNAYFLYCIKQLKHSEAHVYGRMNAIKSYFSLVCKRSEIFNEIIRPKASKALPKVLALNEIKKIFNCTTNTKHLLLLKFAYGMGLRVSELIKLKIEHIDLDRNQVLIAAAKGKKDRVVNFPKSIIGLYNDYLKLYQPKNYVFEGQFEEQYTTRSAQAVFRSAMKKAGIRKNIGIHGLRHSFATHLMESGTDMVFIQKLLGHSQMKTTEIYAKVSIKTLSNVQSPLDNLDE